MNVFSDYHHSALYHSLELLFEKRLNWNLYRPIGKEWAEQDFWRYSTQQDTINQYLEIPSDAKEKDGVYFVFNQRYKNYHKCLTLDKFFSMPIDIVIASVFPHELTFKRLCDLHPSKPKLIRQIGNFNEPVNLDICKNIMDSADFRTFSSYHNVIYYHQEFDLDIFHYEAPKETKKIRSLINCLPHNDYYYLWEEFKNELKEFEWRMHGILGEMIEDDEEKIAETMRDSTFIWQVKGGNSEGYGFVIHQAFALGRPIIVKSSLYKGKPAEKLIEDLKTCIDLDLHSKQEAANLIREYSKPEKHKQLCENAYKRFKEVVDFDKEFETIKKFLENLK